MQKAQVPFDGFKYSTRYVSSGSFFFRPRREVFSGAGKMTRLSGAASSSPETRISGARWPDSSDFSSSTSSIDGSRAGDGAGGGLGRILSVIRSPSVITGASVWAGVLVDSLAATPDDALFRLLRLVCLSVLLFSAFDEADNVLGVFNAGLLEESFARSRHTRRVQ